MLMWLPLPYQRVLAIRLVTPSNLLLSCPSVSLRVLHPSGSSYRAPCSRSSSLALFFASPDATVLSITIPLKSCRHWCFFTSPFLLTNPLPILTSAFSSQHVLFFLSASATQASFVSVRFPALHRLCHASIVISFHTSLEQADKDSVVLPGSDEIDLFQQDGKGALF